MKKICMCDINSQKDFIYYFKRYCKDVLGWNFLGDNPFELKGKQQRMNPRVESALMQFSQIITDFEGDFVDLLEWYDDLQVQ